MLPIAALLTAVQSEHDAGGAASPADMLLRPEPGLWIWTLLIFGTLLFILWRFGWGKLIEQLDTRDRAIRGAVEEARSEREEAERLLAEHKQLLDETRRKTSDMLAEAQSAAKGERQKILDEARRESSNIVARGREQIEQETRNALSQIHSKVADLVIEVTRRLVPRAVVSASHRQLAERFAAELERRGDGHGPQG